MNKKILIILIPIAILLFLVLYTVKNQDFKKAPGKTNNPSGPLVIKANSKIVEDQGELSITPIMDYDIQIIENYIIVWPRQENGFTPKSKYKASFKNYKTESNKTINTEMEFTINISKDYEGLQREVLSKYGVFERSGNPFLEKLPYNIPLSFRIFYDITNEDASKTIHELLGDDSNWKTKKDNYIVYIETLADQGRGDTIENYIQDTLENRKLALEWIQKQGVDTDKDIRYEFIPNDKNLYNSNYYSHETILLEDDIEHDF